MINFKFIYNYFLRIIYKNLKYDNNFFQNANAANFINNKINKYKEIKKEISYRNNKKIEYKKFDIKKSHNYINNKFLVDYHKLYLDSAIKIYSNKNPLFLAAKEILELDNVYKGYISHNLDRFLENFKPKNYAQSFGLKINSKTFCKLSQHSIFYPWFHKYPLRFLRSGLFGPKDKLFKKWISIKIINLVKSIKEFGFVPNDQDKITGYILKKNDDYRFVVTGGSHRCSVILAFVELYSTRFDNFFVEFDNLRVKKGFEIIDINEIDSWPAINSKYIEKKEATDFFNNFFIND